MRILQYKNIDQYEKNDLSLDVDSVHRLYAYGHDVLTVGDLWQDKYEIIGIFQHDASDCYWIVCNVEGTLVEEDITEWFNKYLDDNIPF